MKMWWWLDSLAHKLQLPGRHWICERFDRSLGLTLDEIRRRGPEHESHRDA